jgi:hypothetical protein
MTKAKLPTVLTELDERELAYQGLLAPCSDAYARIELEDEYFADDGYRGDIDPEYEAQCEEWSRLEESNG